GLAEPHSQLAVPIMAAGRLLGMLFVESPEDLRFSYDDEDAMVGLATVVGLAMRHFQAFEEPSSAPAPESVRDACADQEPGPASVALAGVEVETRSQAAAGPIGVRYFDADGSVFFDADYVIKGVAGSILWKLLRDYTQLGRCEFTNRELR